MPCSFGHYIPNFTHWVTATGKTLSLYKNYSNPVLFVAKTLFLKSGFLNLGYEWPEVKAVLNR